MNPVENVHNYNVFTKDPAHPVRLSGHRPSDAFRRLQQQHTQRVPHTKRIATGEEGQKDWKKGDGVVTRRSGYNGLCFSFLLT
jgi:hypothetical protein